MVDFWRLRLEPQGTLFSPEPSTPAREESEFGPAWRKLEPSEFDSEDETVEPALGSMESQCAVAQAFLISSSFQSSTNPTKI